MYDILIGDIYGILRKATGNDNYKSVSIIAIMSLLFGFARKRRLKR